MHNWVTEDISSQSVKLAVVIMVWITWAHIGLPMVWEAMGEGVIIATLTFAGFFGVSLMMASEFIEDWERGNVE